MLGDDDDIDEGIWLLWLWLLLWLANDVDDDDEVCIDVHDNDEFSNELVLLIIEEELQLILLFKLWWFWWLCCCCWSCCWVVGEVPEYVCIVAVVDVVICFCCCCCFLSFSFCFKILASKSLLKSNFGGGVCNNFEFLFELLLTSIECWVDWNTVRLGGFGGNFLRIMVSLLLLVLQLLIEGVIADDDVEENVVVGASVAAATLTLSPLCYFIYY